MPTILPMPAHTNRVLYVQIHITHMHKPTCTNPHVHALTHIHTSKKKEKKNLPLPQITLRTRIPIHLRPSMRCGSRK